MAIIFFGLLTVAGFLQEGPVDVDNVRRRARGFAMLLNAVGPFGMISIGGAIVVAMMIWWYIRCLNRPARFEIFTSAK